MKGLVFCRKAGLAGICTLSLSGCLSGLPDREDFLDPSSDSYISSVEQVDSKLCTWPRPEITSEAETNRDYSKEMVKAQAAYDLGLTGYCVPVAVIDTGLNAIPHRELPRERIRATAYSAAREPARKDSITYRLGLAESFHGVLVAGIIAAQADGTGMHGIAPGAQIRALTLTATSSIGYRELELSELGGADSTVAGWMAYGVRHGSIVNLSVSLLGRLVRETEDGGYEPRYTADKLRQAFPETIRIAAQADRHEDDRTLFVWAAGNNFTDEAREKGALPTSPDLLNGLQAIVPELRGHWLSVVAVSESGEIASFSSRCGIAAEWCIAAPGVCLTGPISYATDAPRYLGRYLGELPEGQCLIYDFRDPDYYQNSGTSFAAPIVSGALALMMERFRGSLGNTAIAERMLATANRKGEYAKAEIYGRGLLDIEAAVSEVGLATLDLPSRSLVVDDLPTHLPDNFGLLRQLGSSLTGVEVMTRDALGGPFWHRFETLPGAVLPSPSVPSASVLLPLQVQRSSVWDGDLLQSRFSRLDFGDATSGYMLEYLAQGSRLFAAVDVPANRLTGMHSMLPVVSGFTDSTAFSLPVLTLVSHDSRGVGASLKTGKSHLSGTLFQGRVQSSSQATNTLGLLEYRWSHGEMQWMLQGGGVFESDSWYGLATENSLYGHFSARTSFGGLMAARAFTKEKNWYLLGAWHSSLTEVKERSVGMLSDETEVAVSRLEMGILGNALMRSGDSLGVRMSWQRMATAARWQLPVDIYRGEVVYADVPVNAESGTERRLEVQYGSVLSQGLALSLRLGAVDGDALSAGYAALHWRLVF